MSWELQCIILGLFAACAYFSYMRGYKNGLTDGAEYALDELERDKIIKVDDKGEIFQHDKYYNK